MENMAGKEEKMLGSSISFFSCSIVKGYVLRAAKAGDRVLRSWVPKGKSLIINIIVWIKTYLTYKLPQQGTECVVEGFICVARLKHLPNGKILNWSKLKAFAEK